MMAIYMAILEAPMPHEYSIAEAKDHLPEAIRTAEAGGPVTFTRRGRPVAVLLSVAEYQALKAPRRDFWQALSRIRDAAGRDGIEFADADFAGLRDAAPGRDVDL
jgi:prevent-host-death family protein